MNKSLRDFYQDIEGDVIGEKPIPASSAKADSDTAAGGGAAAAHRALTPFKQKPSGPLSDKNSSDEAVPQTQGKVVDFPQPQPPDLSEESLAQQVIDAGRQYEHLAGGLKTLTALLDQAKAGSYQALEEIVHQYGFDPDALKITITEPLRDGSGKEPEKYGIKLIHSDEDWKAISRDWETASAYFPDSELHNLPTTRRGKRLAVVMGVTAKEFNAVITAERRRARLESDMQALSGQIEKGRKGMGVDNTPRLLSGNDNKAIASTTPAQAKPVAPKELPARTTR